MASIEANKDDSLISVIFGRFAVLQCIPAAFNSQKGFVAPYVDADGVPINDGRGTFNTTNDTKTAANVSWTFAEGLITPSTPKRGQELSSATFNRLYSIGSIPPRFSAAAALFREWVDTTTYKTVVSTATGVVRLNGRDRGQPPEEPLWACPATRIFTPPEGGTATEEILVAVTFVYPNLRFYTKPIDGGPLMAWTLRATQSVLGLLPDAFDNGGKWLRKCDRNGSANVVSCFINNPFWTEQETSENTRTSKFAWVVDFSVDSYAVTFTEATVETIDRHADRTQIFSDQGSYIGDVGVETFTATGARQIDFDYEGDTKVFTTLEFSGVSRYYFDETSLPAFQTVTKPNPPFWYRGFREIHLKKGLIDVILFKENWTVEFASTGPVFSVDVTQGYLLWYTAGQWVVGSIRFTVSGSSNAGYSDQVYTTNLKLYKDGTAYPLVAEHVRTVSSVGVFLFEWPRYRRATYAGPATSHANKNGIEPTNLSNSINPALNATYVPVGHALAYPYSSGYDTWTTSDPAPWNFRFVGPNFYLMSNGRIKVITTDELAADTYYAVAKIYQVEEGKYVHACSHPAVLTEIKVGLDTEVAKSIRIT